MFWFLAILFSIYYGMAIFTILRLERNQILGGLLGAFLGGALGVLLWKAADWVVEWLDVFQQKVQLFEGQGSIVEILIPSVEISWIDVGGSIVILIWIPIFFYGFATYQK